MEDYLKYNIKVMVQVGCWPFPNTRIQEFWKKTLITCIIGLYILKSISISWAVYDQIDDIFITVEGILEAALMIQSTMKLSTFLTKRNFLREMITIMAELRTINLVPNTENKVKIITNKWMKQAYFWVKLVVVSFSFSITVFICLPWIQYYFTGKKSIFFLSKFQKDDMEWKYFILLDISEIIVGYSSVVLNVAGETFFSSVVMYMCSRIEILEMGIVQSTKEAIETRKTPKLFGDCIEYHKKLLAICQMLEKFYSPMLILQFLNGTISICITSFLALQKSSVVDKGLSFKLYLVGILLELFVYCYFGQFLQTKFENMEIKAAYLEWYDAPLVYQKDIKFFLSYALKPVTFTAYKVSPVNLESFFAICKASLSYYTILRSFTEEEN